TLNQWRDAVAHGKLPAAIFNATAVESGQRFLVATTDVPDRGALRFAERFPEWDIPIATAARLSATFTYVSPAARPTGGTAAAPPPPRPPRTTAPESSAPSNGSGRLPPPMRSTATTCSSSSLTPILAPQPRANSGPGSDR